MEGLLLLWKLMLVVDFGSGRHHGLECQVLTMISIFWIVLRFSGI